MSLLILKSELLQLGELDNPTFSQICSCVAAVDGKQVFMVIFTNRISYIDIRGTQQGHYLVDVELDNRSRPFKIYRLVDATLLESTDSFYLKFENGEANDVPVYYAVTQDVAIKAIADFIFKGKLSENLTWQNEANQFFSPS